MQRMQRSVGFPEQEQISGEWVLAWTDTMRLCWSCCWSYRWWRLLDEEDSRYVQPKYLWQGSTYIAITNRTFSVGTVFHALVKQLLLTSPFKRSEPEYFTMIFVTLKFFSLWSLHIVSLAINDLQCFSNSSLSLLSNRFSLVLSSFLLPLSTSTACTSASAI